jgi:hypothetical protein
MKKLVFVSGIILSISLCCVDETLAVSQGEGIDKNLQQLLNIAENSDAWVWERNSAIEKIIKKRDMAAIPILIRISENKRSLVRTKAVEALGILGDTRAIPILQVLQKDEFYLIKEAASKALIKLEGSRSSPGITQEITMGSEEIPETKPKAEPVVEKEIEIETDSIKAINNTFLFQTERRDPAFACFLSMVTLGGGQIYNYQPRKAIIAYLLSGLSLAGIFSNNVNGAACGSVVFLGTWIWSVFDSYNSAVDINKELEYKYKLGVNFRY